MPFADDLIMSYTGNILFICQELNVKKLTTTTDKEKYGARLHAEPDHRVLGAKLKQQFKAVSNCFVTNVCPV